MRNPNWIHRAPEIRSAGISWVLITPKVAGLVVSKEGSRKFGWLNRLKKSAENSTFNRSVIDVDFPRRASRFQKPRPRKGLFRPSLVSVARSVGRNFWKAAPGSAK